MVNLWWRIWASGSPPRYFAKKATLSFPSADNLQERQGLDFMVMRPVYPKGIVLLDRYWLDSYSEEVVGEEEGVGNLARKYTFKDLKVAFGTISLIDEGGEGLDTVIVDDQIEGPISPENLKLFEEARAVPALKLRHYLRQFQEACKPTDLVSDDLHVRRVASSGNDASRITERFEIKKRSWGEGIRWIVDGTVDGEGNYDVGAVTLGDPETGLLVRLSIPEGRDLVAGLLISIEPLLRLSCSPQAAIRRAMPSLSGEWLPFLSSEEFVLLDGEWGTGGPGDNDYELARIAIHHLSQDGHEVSPEAVREMLKRYPGKKNPKAFEDFLHGERSAAYALAWILDKSIPLVLYGSSARRPTVEIDGVGALWATHSDRRRQGTDQPGHLLEDFDKLLRKYSGGQRTLRARTLQDLRECLHFENGKLFYRDPEDRSGRLFRLPPNFLMELFFGSPEHLGLGVSVDGYYFHDSNGDGWFRRDDDAISRKESESHFRYLPEVSPHEMMKDLGRCLSPPFDPKKLEEEGVSLAELRTWAEQVHPHFLAKKRWAKNPLEDGAYRVMIYRPLPGDLSPDSLLFSLFLSLNGFDDVIVVPLGWGMETALNEIAARNIPLDLLYIGSHGERFVMGDFLMDYDRRLVFAKGGKVVSTGCKMDRETAGIVGASLFRYSAGTLVWGDGMNIPSPFGSIWSFGGDPYETRFEIGGIPVETQTIRLHDVDASFQ